MFFLLSIVLLNYSASLLETYQCHKLNDSCSGKKHIEFPLIADAREWSRMGSCGTFMEDATSEVTGKANELRRSRFVIHRFCAYHHIRPPPVLKVGILLVSLKK
jgi:hypothetical protein